MGYSAHVPCKSKKERDEMFAFLEEHYRPFSKVVAGAGCLDYFVADEKEFENRNFEHHDSICGPCREGLSYIPDDSDFYIGFDFMTSGGAEGQWMFEFLRWVATKVGVRYLFDFGAQVPFIVYDIPTGPDDLDSRWPILERSEFRDVDEKLQQFVTDNSFKGMLRVVQSRRKMSWNPQQYDFWERVATRADLYFRKELRRLDELWAAQAFRG